VHFFPKAKIGEFKIEAYDVAIGDTILVTGTTTGAQELEVTDMLVNDEKLNKGTKGDSVTIPLSFRIRQSDKLYKIVENKVDA
jgi:putative protease